jgi:hypothetical protein
MTSRESPADRIGLGAERLELAAFRQEQGGGLG